MATPAPAPYGDLNQDRKIIRDRKCPLALVALAEVLLPSLHEDAI